LEKTMRNQNKVTELIKSVSGQANILTIPRIYIDLTGDHISALFLSQCVYWSDRGRDGWFYKSASEWEDELGLSSYQVRRCIKSLAAYIQTDVRKANGAPTTHYKVDFEELRKSIVEKLNNPLLRNSTIHCEETQQSLTETTTETTAETTAEEEGEPAAAAEAGMSVINGIVADACGMVTIPPDERERNEQVYQLYLSYGREALVRELKDACDKWTKTRSAKSGKYYRITNMGWVDWAQEALMEIEIKKTKKTEPERKIILPDYFGGT